MNIAERLRLRKEKHPEEYCRANGCLWHTSGQQGVTPCRKHPVPEGFDHAENEAAIRRLNATLQKDFPPRGGAK